MVPYANRTRNERLNKLFFFFYLFLVFIFVFLQPYRPAVASGPRMLSALLLWVLRVGERARESGKITQKGECRCRFNELLFLQIGIIFINCTYIVWYYRWWKAKDVGQRNGWHFSYLLFMLLFTRCQINRLRWFFAEGEVTRYQHEFRIWLRSSDFNCQDHSQSTCNWYFIMKNLLMVLVRCVPC